MPLPDRLRSLFSRTRLSTVIAIGAIFGVGAVTGAQDAAPESAAPGPRGPVELPDNPERTVAQTAPGWVAELALRYQPIVMVAKADRFWPVSVSSVLRLRATGKTTCLGSRRQCPPALAPTWADLMPGTGSGDYLAYPGLRDKAQNQFEGMLQSLGISGEPARWITDPRSSPYESAQIYFFLAAKLPDTGRDLTPDLLSLQYWFFYPFNYLPIVFDPFGLPDDPEAATKRNWNYHEGDWEHVSVLLRPVRGHARDTFRPEYVYMARHDTEGELFAWKKLKSRGTHAIVHSSLGGHTSYDNCGIHGRKLGPGLIHPVIGRVLYDVAVCDRNRPVPRGAPAGAVFEFGPGTKLVELKPRSWACWRGRFGSIGKKIFGVPRSLSRLADGPAAPLHQFENRGLCDAH